MAEIEITLPTVQYGNVKVKATPDELGLESVEDATGLGIATAVYLNLFVQGFKSGSQMDVSASLGASQPIAEAQAQRYLDEGLGGVTEVSDWPSDEEEDARTGDEYTKAPWDEPAVDSKPKPWETEW